MILISLTVIVVTALVFRVYTGFGFSIFFVSLISLLQGWQFAVLVSIICEAVLCALLAVRFRPLLALREAFTLKVLSLIGVLLATFTASFIPSKWVGLVAGISVVALVVSRLVRPTREVLRALYLHVPALAGITSGFLGYHSSISGPFIVLHYEARHEEGIVLRGKLTGYFLLLYAWLLLTRGKDIIRLAAQQGMIIFAAPIIVLTIYPVAVMIDGRLAPSGLGSERLRRIASHTGLGLAGLLLIIDSVIPLQ